ncbi:MAG: nonspecific lipid-transfer protein [Pseudomonadales bacterium]|nr:nonspecific lipid-transfer protein [Pseudomonadales bacterium]
MSRKPVICGIGRTAFSRNSERTTLAQAAEAARTAITDAGMLATDIDGVACFAMGDSAPGMAVAHAVGIDDLNWNMELFGGGYFATSVVANAGMAVQTGACDAVLVFRSLNGRSGKRYGRADGGGTKNGSAATSRTAMQVGGERQFAAPHGYMTPPQWLALWCRQHQHRYGSSCEDLGQIAITQRQHAENNPHAVQRGHIDMQDYLAGRWINEPFRVFDCALEVDGAVAMIVTTEERARDLKQTPVSVVAHAEYTGHGGLMDQWPDYTTMYSEKAGPLLWQRAGIKPNDVDIACMYDCFTYTVMATMEGFGLCQRGEVGSFFAAGRATYGGEVVVNPHGGLLSEGYIHGLNHTFEAVLQLRNQAEKRQVEGATTALVTAGAGPFGGGMILRAGV